MTQLPPDMPEIAHRLADEARQAILPFFRGANLATENKATHRFDPVTAADRAAEAAMRAVLQEARPDDGILGEEFGTQAGSTEWTWVLDPIDGTRGFVAGTPTWGVLIAVSDETGPKLGIVDQPYIGERFIGFDGAAYVNGPMGQARIKTGSTQSLQEATLFTTFPEVGSAVERVAFEAVASKAKLVRYGMDCYAYALLAAGQIDLVIEAGLEAYDIQAPIALIEAAGGRVTDWSGNPAHNGGRALAAANPDIHAAALEILRPFV